MLSRKGTANKWDSCRFLIISIIPPLKWTLFLNALGRGIRCIVAPSQC